MPTAKIPSPNADYDLPDPQAIRETLGGRIRDHRKFLRMSQVELAQNIGKESSTYISLIEKGTRNISAVELVRMAHHFKLPLSYFYP